MIKLPEHKCGLYLQHNEHRDLYETAADYIADNDRFQWKDEESKQRAIDTNEIWTLQWYPETPVGFCAAAAPTLEELLAYVNGE